MTLRGFALLALLAATGIARADNDESEFTLDPVHTRVMVGVSHAGFSQAMGTISGSTGTVRFVPGDWSGARVDVTVPVGRLDLGDAKWNAAALAANLLDAKRYPEARFVSSTVESVDEQHARACGQFTLHGVTRPLCLEVTFNQLKRHPLPPFRRTAGFSATATLSRKEFGITAWPSVIGDTVTLRIEAEAVRGNPRGVADPAAGADEPVDTTSPEAPPPPEAVPGNQDAPEVPTPEERPITPPPQDTPTP